MPDKAQILEILYITLMLFIIGLLTYLFYPTAMTMDKNYIIGY